MIKYEHDTVNQYCVCLSDKLLSKVFIEKEIGGYSFFVIKYEKGSVPKELSGQYTSIPEAQCGLERYLRNRPVSKVKQVREYADKREKERNAAKSKSEGS